MEFSSLDKEYIENNLFLSLEKGINDFKKSSPEYERYVTVKKGTMDLVLSIITEKDDFIDTPTNYEYVTSSDLSDIGMSVDEALSRAIENSSKLFPYELTKLEDYVSVNMDPFETPSTFVLTNNLGFNSAAALFTQSHILEEIAEESNIHQVVILPVSKEFVLMAAPNSEEDKEHLLASYNSLATYLKCDIGLNASGGLIVYDDSLKKMNELNWYGEAYSLSLKEEANYSRTR